MLARRFFCSKFVPYLLNKNQFITKQEIFARSTNIGRCLATLNQSDAKEISIVKPTIVNDNVTSEPIQQIDLLTQADITDPLTFELSNLDLSNTNVNITPIREAWIENMSTPNSIKLGILPLNPKIFSVFPRPDLIQKNYQWQLLYKHVDWTRMRTKAELSGSNKKPWPQKGLGKARHATRRAPQWKKGGWANGPRGPRTFFYMLPWTIRVDGLKSMLAAKLAQNDLYVVDSFSSFPTDATASHLEELCEARGWGPSVLFVDKINIDENPKCESLCQAINSIQHINFMPAYSLNVFSMLKYETLVLTVDAMNDIQQKLLFQLKRIDIRNVMFPQKPRNVFRY